MSLSKSTLSHISLLAAGILFPLSDVLAGFDELNMPVGVTPISREVYDLHMIILWICVAIGVVVFGVMFYSIVNHRKSTGKEAAQFHHSTTAEIVWTVIPFVILVVMAIPATKALILMEDTSEADMTIKVTGYQWKWRYEYLEDDISFFSDLALSSREAIYGDAPKPEHYLLDVNNPVVVPIDKKIRFLITADDVIHAWWVPALGMKKDAIPGFINEMWAKIEQPGVYRGQCAELCGKDHGFMPIVVIAKTDDEYQAWVAEHKSEMVAETVDADREWTSEELIAKGETVYSTYCAACHQPGGEGVPDTFPAIKGSLVATGPSEEHLALVFNGKQGTAMQAFGAQLSDVDLAAVVTYQRNEFGNDMGDLVQPSMVRALR